MASKVGQNFGSGVFDKERRLVRVFDSIPAAEAFIKDSGILLGKRRNVMLKHDN